MDYFKQDLGGTGANRNYINVFLRSHNQQRVYKRETYDIFTYISDLGGGFDVLVIVIGSLSGLLSANLFKAAFVEAAYRIQESQSEEVINE